MTSAGSRSGVNWMRLNVVRTVSASVRTVSVFARPGTPSSSTWPPVRSAISRRSTMVCCPTTRSPTCSRMSFVSERSFGVDAISGSRSPFW
jgi:hypothetical protein